MQETLQIFSLLLSHPTPELLVLVVQVRTDRVQEELSAAFRQLRDPTLNGSQPLVDSVLLHNLDQCVACRRGKAQLLDATISVVAEVNRARLRRTRLTRR